MALPPHWLDDVFERPETAVQKLLRGERLWRALEEAKDAYERQKQAFEQQPKLIGASPAQAARQAFLESLELQAK